MMFSAFLNRLKTALKGSEPSTGEAGESVYGWSLEAQVKQAHSGNPSAYGRIFCMLKSGDRTGAATFLCRESERLTPGEIITICERMNWSLYLEYDSYWYDVRLKHFLRPCRSPEEIRSALFFASFYPGGYVREEAVRRLAACDMALPFILHRLNDWVPQVREAAHEAFRVRLQNPVAGELAESIPEVLKLRRKTRGTHHAELEAFRRALASPEKRPELERAMEDASAAVRLFCVDTLLDAPRPDEEELFRLLEQERSPHIRFHIFLRLLRNETADRRKIADRMLGERYAKIRVCALRYLYEEKAADSCEVALRYLADCHASVRESARWIVSRQSSGFDFAAFYRERVERDPVNALAGLGETGKAEDAGLILPFLESGHSGCVRAAIRALMRLDGRMYAGQVIPLLDDEREEVANEAFRQLAAGDLTGAGDRIYQVLRGSSREFCRRKCAALLMRIPGKWEQLRFILLVLGDDGESLRKIALERIPFWCSRVNCSFTVLAEEQRNELVALLCRNREKLPLKEFKQLQFYLKN